MRNRCAALRFALLALALTDGLLPFSPAGAQSQVFAKPGQRPTQTQRLAESCVADASAPFSLYGQAAQPLNASGALASYAYILPASALTTSYIGERIAMLIGDAAPTPTMTGEFTTEYVREQFAQARERTSLMFVAKNAPVLPDGHFVCRGFPPGRYSVYAIVNVLATTRTSGGGKVPVVMVYRGDVDTGRFDKKNKNRLVPVILIEVGQSPA